MNGAILNFLFSKELKKTFSSFQKILTSTTVLKIDIVIRCLSTTSAYYDFLKNHESLKTLRLE